MSRLTVVATVGLDDRDEGVLSAVRAVTTRHPGGRVVVLHVVEPGTPAVSGAVERLAAEVGGEARAAVGAVDDVTAHVLAETGADLLVIGRGAAEDGHAAWGEHGRNLLRAAGCPVLVVPAGASADRFRRAAVGMDLSATSLDALALAGQLADRVEAVAVLNPEEHGGERAVREAVASRFAEALAERGLSATLRVEEGASPTDVLLALAREVDLVAVGSRGLSPLATVFLGSTAERLAGRSPRPVLVVRRRGATRGLFEALFRS